MPACLYQLLFKDWEAMDVTASQSTLAYVL